MQTLKRLGLLGLLLTFSTVVFAQKKAEVIIKSSAQCEMCKEKIEDELHSRKAIKKATVDVTAQEITVIYNPIKTNEEEIKEWITDLGYSAGDLPPSEDAYNQLPDCCKRPEDQNK